MSYVEMKMMHKMTSFVIKFIVGNTNYKYGFILIFIELLSGAGVVLINRILIFDNLQC